MGPAIAGLFFLVFFGAMIAGLVFWIMKIVEVAGIPEPQYRAAGTDKTVWVLVVVLAGWIGALIWQLAKRDEVLRARGLLPPPGAFGPVWGGPPAPGWGQQLPGPGYGATQPGPGYGMPQPPGWGQQPPTVPAGWYPEPDSGWSAYWDGYRWTGSRRPPEQAAPRPDLEKRPD